MSAHQEESEDKDGDRVKAGMSMKDSWDGASGQALAMTLFGLVGHSSIGGMRNRHVAHKLQERTRQGANRGARATVWQHTAESGERDGMRRRERVRSSLGAHPPSGWQGADIAPFDARTPTIEVPRALGGRPRAVWSQSV